MHIHLFHTRFQCIQISTRINSTSVHTYILHLFYIASSIRMFILINPIFNNCIHIHEVWCPYGRELVTTSWCLSNVSNRLHSKPVWETPGTRIVDRYIISNLQQSKRMEPWTPMPVCFSLTLYSLFLVEKPSLIVTRIWISKFTQEK